MDSSVIKSISYNQEHLLKLWDDDCQVNCYNIRCRQPGLSREYGCSKCSAKAPKCRACSMPQRHPLDPFYYYDSYKYFRQFIHKSCAEFPQEILLSIHPRHPLVYAGDFHKVDDSWKECDICNRWRINIRFRCRDCNFQIHMGCALKFIKYHEGREHIQHFSHEHPLAFLPELDADTLAECQVCGTEIYGPSYVCASCDFYLHKSCLDEIHQEIEHPFHPLHTLTLKKLNRGLYFCKACNHNSPLLAYHCHKCDFQLHLKCASLIPSIEYENHNHHLSLVKCKHDYQECEACGSPILGAYCACCVECNLYYHVNCHTDTLPTEIRFKHHSHPLTLVNIEATRNTYHLYHILLCDVCKKKRNPRDPFYYCDQCEYSTHVHCVVTEVQLCYKEKVRHFSHKHFLTRYENSETNNTFSCDACEKKISSDTPAYHCERCNVFLHGSCVSLQREILHPFHPHSLTLERPLSHTEPICYACNKYFNGFAYRCEKCNFHLDVDCALLRPSIKLKEHEHELTFFKLLHGRLECIVCRSNTSKANWLRCAECNYNIHVMCCPLPETIKHVSHHGHLLTLKDYFVEDESDDDQYCDYCEEIRATQECVYCCEGCRFVVDFNCVLEEVLLSINGVRANVKFRSVRTKKGPTLLRVLASFSEDEKKKLISVYEDALLEVPKVKRGRDSFLEKAVGESDTACISSMEKLGKHIIRLDFWDWEDVVIKVKNYMIPESLAPILTKILEIHGDIGAKGNLTRKLKLYMLTMICGAAQSMCNTNVADVNTILVERWSWCFKVGQSAGFNVKFAINHLENIASVYRFYVNESQRDTYIYELLKTKTELSNEIDQLTGKVAEIDKEIRENVASIPSMIVREQKERLYEIIELKMNTAGKGLLKARKN